MPGILIERGGYLREILQLLGAAAWDCQWLITGLECYDTCGWEGCEKWGQETLLLSNGDFLRDVEARDMQFVWGIFSAIPASYTREEIFAHPLPAFHRTRAGRAAISRTRSCPSIPWPFWRSSARTAPLSPSSPGRQTGFALCTACLLDGGRGGMQPPLARTGAGGHGQLAALGYGAVDDPHPAETCSTTVWRSRSITHRPDRPIRAEESEVERMLRRERRIPMI